MAEKIVNIAKNTSYFTLALVLQKIISLTYFTIYARELGPEVLGRYYSAIAFTSIFSIFIDLGLTNFLTREISKRQEDAKKFLSNIIFIKLILSVFTLIVALIVANFWGYSEETIKLIYISSISMVLDSFTTTFFSCSRGFHNLKYESISSVLFQVIILIGSVLILYSNKSITALMLVMVLASVFNFIYSASINFYKWGLTIKPTKDIALIKNILTTSLPFAVYAIAQKIYTFLDSLLLFKFLGDKEVGLYQIPFKIITALQFLPLAFTASLYPALSSYWKNNKEQLAITFERAINYSIIISLPIVAGIFLLADKIVIIFQSDNDYSGAIWPLKIIILSLFFVFIGYPVGSLLNACDQQKNNTKNMIITAVFSLILNLIVIPKFGVSGASMTVFVSNFLMFLLGWRFVSRIVKINLKNIILVLMKSLASSLLMSLFIVLFFKSMNIFIAAFLGAIIYFIALLIFKALNKKDLLSILKSFKLR
jgi:O-antigen/teichoic acid export membrane protein